MKATDNKRTKYVCKNCGCGVEKDGVEAMRKAGFALRHLACPNCGDHGISYRNPERYEHEGC